MTAGGIGFFISAVALISMLVWWVRHGLAVVERRVIIDVRRAMENSDGWRSLSIFAYGGYARPAEQRQLAARLWKLGIVMLVMIASLMLIAGGLSTGS